MAGKKARAAAGGMSPVSYALIAIAAAILSVILANYAVAYASAFMTFGACFFGIALANTIRSKEGKAFSVILLIIWLAIVISAYSMSLMS